MDRNEVYRLIDGERAYQDAKWGSIDQNPHTIGEWLIIAWHELGEAAILVPPNSAHDALSELRQVAAVCIAALEQHGCPPREGYEFRSTDGAQTSL